MRIAIGKTCVATFLAAGGAAVLLAGCGSSAAPANTHHSTNPAPTHAPAKPKPTCSGKVTIGSLDTTAAAATVYRQLTSATCLGAVPVIRSGLTVAWVGHVSAAPSKNGKLVLTVTRTKGLGRHPQVVYSSTVSSSGSRTLNGSFTAQQLRAKGINPGTYLVAYTRNGSTVAQGSFQLGTGGSGQQPGY